MPETTLRVSVVYAEEESEDRRLAEELRQELAELVVVQMCSIDDIAASLQRNRYERAMIIATPVFILSEASTGEAQRRRAVVYANPVLGHLNFRSYYICRGVTPLQLLERHAELGRLANEAMIVSEDAKASCVEDIREYAHSKAGAPPVPGDLLRTMVVSGRYLVAALASLLGSLGALLFLLGLPAGIVLVVLEARGTPPLIASLLVLTCLCAAGTALHMVESLEVWPWLGPRWRLARGERDHDGTGSTFSLSELDAALSRFRQARRWAASYGGVVMGVLLGPSLFAAFTSSAPAVTWMLAAVVFGLSSPPLKTWAHRVFAHFEAGRRGLLDESLERFESHVARLDVKPMPHSLAALDPDVLKQFDEHDLAQIRRWINVAALGSNSSLW